MIELFISGDFCPILRLEHSISVSSGQQVLGYLMDLLESADLRITNLECPITNADMPISKTGPALKAIPRAANFLSETGFNLVTLANNHIMDYGPDGLFDTISYLNECKIKYFGAGVNYSEASKAFRYEKEGIRISILNFAENEWSTTHGNYPGASPIDPVKNFSLIQEEKKLSDHVIVIAHGGHEMYEYPSPRMKELYRFYIDAGASAVINHHTHCISGWENYKDGFIHYSLGNFLFDHRHHRIGVWNFGAAITLLVTKEKIDHTIHYFHQGGESVFIQELSNTNADRIIGKVDQINATIQDDHSLETEYDEYVNTVSRMYRTFLEPVKNKYVNALQNRKIFPRLYGLKNKRLLLNLVRCESHRDILKEILKKDVSDPSK